MNIFLRIKVEAVFGAVFSTANRDRVFLFISIFYLCIERLIFACESILSIFNSPINGI